MTPSDLFQICNTVVLPAWLLLIFAPRWKWTPRIVLSGIVIFLCIIYAMGLTEAIEKGGLDLTSFGSLPNVMELFTEASAVLIGWVHYLAFDLVVGCFIVKNAEEHDINQWLVAPCLLFTFMLGPVGFLLYWIIRSVKTKQYWPN
ncbi:MAG: ABA4-like family protein [Bacteroidota bacterium]